MSTSSAGTDVTGLRGIWLGTGDFGRARAFYELLGAKFEARDDLDGIVLATLGGTRLIFEAGENESPGKGPFLLFDVTDADALHAAMKKAGYAVEGPPKDEPWGRQFNVLDPDGYSVAFIGPSR